MYYKDRTFCSNKECKNSTCYRHLSEEDWDRIREEDWLVCISDYDKNCKEYY